MNNGRLPVRNERFSPNEGKLTAYALFEMLKSQRMRCEYENYRESEGSQEAPDELCSRPLRHVQTSAADPRGMA